MIKLCKLNNEEILLNEDQIEFITFIPESKVIMMNKEFIIVRESGDEIVSRILEFKSRILAQANKNTD